MTELDDAVRTLLPVLDEIRHQRPRLTDEQIALRLVRALKKHLPKLAIELGDRKYAKAEVDRHFADFWAYYPRKKGKALAWKKYELAIQSVGPSVILEGLHKWLESPDVPDADFIPYPATWIHQQRWLDESPPASTRPERRFKPAPGYTEEQFAELFSTFWESYPRKCNYGVAREAFRSAIAEHGHADIIAGVQRYANDPNRQREERFIPTPVNWLERMCWNDAPAQQIQPNLARGNSQFWDNGGDFGMPGAVTHRPDAAKR